MTILACDKGHGTFVSERQISLPFTSAALYSHACYIDPSSYSSHIHAGAATGLATAVALGKWSSLQLITKEVIIN